MRRRSPAFNLVEFSMAYAANRYLHENFIVRGDRSREFDEFKRALIIGKALQSS
jgi:hypothetical protein